MSRSSTDMASSMAAHCSLWVIRLPARPASLSASINYIKPGIGGKLIAIAQEISRGRTTGVYEIFIFNDKEVLLCRATFTMFFLDQDRYHKKKQDAPKAEG